MKTSPAALALLLATAWPLASNAATVYVDAANLTGTEDGSAASPFRTIQPALDAAVAGDTVLVAPGTYVGGLSLKQGVPLEGAQGPAVTIIDAAGAVNALTLPGEQPAGSVPEASVRGFTLRNPGGGIAYVTSPIQFQTAILHVDECVLEDAAYGIAGGFFAHLDVSRSVVRRVQDAIWMSSFGVAQLSNVTIDAASGYALLANAAASIGLYNVTVSNSGTGVVVRYSSYYGGGSMYGSNVNVWNAPVSVWAGGSFSVTAQLSADPRFVDPPRDHHLLPGSPLVDAGTTALPAGLPVPAYVGAAPDIGAHELVDLIAPVTTVQLAGVPGQGGWFLSPVTVTLAASDQGGSGVASTAYSLDGTTWVVSTAPFTLSNEGVTTLWVRSTDGAGNVEAATATDVRIDLHGPTIALSTPAAGDTYLLRQRVLASWSASDAVSGLASATGTVPSGAALDTATVGSKSFAVAAGDVAGNASLSAAPYAVHYAFGGFRAPLTGGDATVRRPSPVAVRYQLRDALGALVGTATGRVFVAPVVGGVVGAESPAAPQAGGGNLVTWDARARQYVFNLSTRALALGVWQVRVALDDGASYTARFTLR